MVHASDKLVFGVPGGRKLVITLLLGVLAALLMAGSITTRTAHADTWRYVNSWNDADQQDNHGVFFYINNGWYPLPIEVWMSFDSHHYMSFWYDYTNGEYLNVYVTDYLGWSCEDCQNLPGGLQVYLSDWDQHYTWTQGGWQFAATAYPNSSGPCFTQPGWLCFSGWVSVDDGYWDTIDYLYEQAGSNGYGWWQASTWTVEYFHNYTHYYHY